jgi:hypothetical protein
MRRSTALMSVAAVAFMASNAFAQAKPNFAGTWNLVQDPAAQQAAAAGAGGNPGGRGGRGGFGGALGMTGTITQDDKTLTIKTTRGQNEIVTTYNLDGSDSKNTAPGRGGNPGTEQISHAKWDGTNLVITRTQDMGGTSVEIKQIFSIDAAGNLNIETVRPGQDGAPVSTKVQYKKA